MGVCALLVFATLVALGSWQVARRAWKLDLIERVEQRIHAAPVAPPSFADWQRSPDAARESEYLHVRLKGTFDHAKEVLVQANTTMGAGFWVVTPLRQADGTAVLVNRGFVPPEARDPAARGVPAPQGNTEVVGLLRLSEPGGGFLRHNDPAGDRWFSRDVQAIAAVRGIAPVAPYFIDAEAAVHSAAQPVANTSTQWPAGGLTVVRFPNSHLVYAITWYTLALMVAAGAWVVWRDDQKRRRRSAPPADAALH
ncbi:SURF1 family protein [Acidovorax sp. SUPP3334]|uniref:SURF1 family protein n=1 Tax=Acidovorax sp. SUPP3334 TaxID=2920881 RepID=UPI0024E07628|nr:SURF1 family protein [Acidovorax sp. SUPP3334]